MKVLQIDKYYYRKGGAETVFFNTIELLQNQGHTVVPFSIKSGKNHPSPYSNYFVDYPELSESGLWTKIRYAPAFVYNANAASQIEKLIREEKPDIAHIHLLFNSMSVSILPVLKKYKIPVVMTVHDYRLICPAYTFTDGKGNLCERCLQSQGYWHCVINRCSKGNFFNSILLASDSYFRKYFISPTDYIDKFIFVSKFAQNKHIDAMKGFKDKSTLLYNFTPIHKEKPIRKQDYILFFGRISEEKGINTLIQAVTDTSVQLKIVGTGPLLERFKKDKQPNIDFVGFKSGEELQQYIEQALFVVVPSEWYENNPLSIIESMVSGTPVIGSRIGGIPELIEEGVSGYLFQPRSVAELQQAINKAIHLPVDAYERMCAAARSFGKENFSGETHYEKLMQIYSSVTKSHEPY